MLLMDIIDNSKSFQFFNNILVCMHLLHSLKCFKLMMLFQKLEFSIINIYFVNELNVLGGHDNCIIILTGE